MTRPSFSIHPDTRFLYQLLEKLTIDEEITYAEISTQAGFPVDGSSRPLQSAKRMLLKEDRVFETIRGKGVKRLNDQDIVKSTQAENAAIRNKARRGARKLTSVQDFSKLSNAEQLEYSVKMAGFTIIAEAASKRGQALIESAAKSRPVTAGDLPLAMIASAFTRKPATSNA